MEKYNTLKIGDTSDNGQIIIIDEDRLCYLVKSTSRGALGVRTISKKLLEEYVAYFANNPDASANDARDALSGNSDIDKFEYGYTSTLKVMAQMVLGKIDVTTTKDFSITTSETEYPLQQIFYGAPGTGKSNTIRRVVDEQKKISFRTTFHPDSDYSTFVGAYKPTMKESTITKDGVTTKEEKIIYTFCPQAFTNAYVKAWNTDEEVYLIIEEINRGNCAQIFGDLFQLLDRKNGESEYPVEADADLQSYLQKELADTTRTDIPEDVKSGKILKLPSNLYIWATMNTSDQSLFPIDSAFKRRWEWKYIKIKEGKDEYGNKLNWKIDVKPDDTGEQLSWWDFIKKINEIIASMTSSADKQLGYFFCCAKDGVIDEETFVSKVIFYLWNDVFKDYGFEDASLFRYTDKEGKEQDLTFPDFYDEDGEKVNTERLTDFVKKVMNWKKTNAEQD